MASEISEDLIDEDLIYDDCDEDCDVNEEEEQALLEGVQQNGRLNSNNVEEEIEQSADHFQLPLSQESEEYIEEYQEHDANSNEEHILENIEHTSEFDDGLDSQPLIEEEEEEDDDEDDSLEGRGRDRFKSERTKISLTDVKINRTIPDSLDDVATVTPSGDFGKFKKGFRGGRGGIRFQGRPQNVGVRIMGVNQHSPMRPPFTFQQPWRPHQRPSHFPLNMMPPGPMRPPFGLGRPGFFPLRPRDPSMQFAMPHPPLGSRNPESAAWNFNDPAALHHGQQIGGPIASNFAADVSLPPFNDSPMKRQLSEIHQSPPNKQMCLQRPPTALLPSESHANQKGAVFNRLSRAPNKIVTNPNLRTIQTVDIKESNHGKETEQSRTKDPIEIKKEPIDKSEPGSELFSKPEEEEYRRKVEEQQRKRAEVLAKKELRRKAIAASKAKEVTVKEEPLEEPTLPAKEEKKLSFRQFAKSAPQPNGPREVLGNRNFRQIPTTGGIQRAGVNVHPPAPAVQFESSAYYNSPQFYQNEANSVPGFDLSQPPPSRMPLHNTDNFVNAPNNVRPQLRPPARLPPPISSNSQFQPASSFVSRPPMPTQAGNRRPPGMMNRPPVLGRHLIPPTGANFSRPPPSFSAPMNPPLNRPPPAINSGLPGSMVARNRGHPPFQPMTSFSQPPPQSSFRPRLQGQSERPSRYTRPPLAMMHSNPTRPMHSAPPSLPQQFIHEPEPYIPVASQPPPSVPLHSDSSYGAYEEFPNDAPMDMRPYIPDQQSNTGGYQDSYEDFGYHGGQVNQQHLQADHVLTNQRQSFTKPPPGIQQNLRYSSKMQSSSPSIDLRSKLSTQMKAKPLIQGRLISAALKEATFQPKREEPQVGNQTVFTVQRNPVRMVPSSVKKRFKRVTRRNRNGEVISIKKVPIDFDGNVIGPEETEYIHEDLQEEVDYSAEPVRPVFVKKPSLGLGPIAKTMRQIVQSVPLKERKPQPVAGSYESLNVESVQGPSRTGRIVNRQQLTSTVQRTVASKPANASSSSLMEYQDDHQEGAVKYELTGQPMARRVINSTKRVTSRPGASSNITVVPSSSSSTVKITNLPTDITMEDLDTLAWMDGTGYFEELHYNDVLRECTIRYLQPSIAHRFYRKMNMSVIGRNTIRAHMV